MHIDNARSKDMYHIRVYTWPIRCCVHIRLGQVAYLHTESVPVELNGIRTRIEASSARTLHKGNQSLCILIFPFIQILLLGKLCTQLIRIITAGYKYVPLALCKTHTINQIQVTYFFGSGHPLGVGVEQISASSSKSRAVSIRSTSGLSMSTVTSCIILVKLHQPINLLI